MNISDFFLKFFPILLAVVMIRAFRYAKKKSATVLPELQTAGAEEFDRTEEEEAEEREETAAAEEAETDSCAARKPLVSFEEEEEEKPFLDFDIRHAVIASEILKRPEY